jgi:hypothetical protein
MDVIRAGSSLRMGNVRVRLVRKLAERIDGVDLSRRSVGQVIRLPADQARLLIAEQWAEPLKLLTPTEPSVRCPPSAEELPTPYADGRARHKES